MSMEETLKLLDMINTLNDTVTVQTQSILQLRDMITTLNTKIEVLEKNN